MLAVTVYSINLAIVIRVAIVAHVTVITIHTLDSYPALAQRANI